MLEQTATCDQSPDVAVSDIESFIKDLLLGLDQKFNGEVTFNEVAAIFSSFTTVLSVLIADVSADDTRTSILTSILATLGEYLNDQERESLMKELSVILG